MSQSTDPTPREIFERCLEIQRTWSPSERLRRLRVDLRPVVSGADGREHDVDAADYFEHHEAHEATHD